VTSAFAPPMDLDLDQACGDWVFGGKRSNSYLGIGTLTDSGLDVAPESLGPLAFPRTSGPETVSPCPIHAWRVRDNFGIP
jgi:hypothetical protein